MRKDHKALNYKHFKLSIVLSLLTLICAFWSSTSEAQNTKTFNVVPTLDSTVNIQPSLPDKEPTFFQPSNQRLQNILKDIQDNKVEPLDIKQFLKDKTGGDWQSSGGSGVICFKDPTSAQNYGTAVRNKTIIDARIYQAIESVKTLDYWEAENQQKYLSGADYQDILNQINENLRRYSSLMAYRYDQIRRLTAFSKWKGLQNLESVQDFNLKRQLTENEKQYCRIGQLAVRYTLPVEIEKMPPVLIVYDEELWQKMDALNKAMLIMHEYTYYFGKHGDPQNSDRSRIVTRLLASADFWQMFASNSKKMSTTLMELFSYHFGNYHTRFFEAENSKSGIKPYTQASRYQSLRSLIDKMQNFVDKCVMQKLGRLQPQDQVLVEASNVCKSEMHHSQELQDTFTEEEAFIYTARFVAVPNFIKLPLIDSELLYVSWNDARFKAASAQALQTYCQFAQIFSSAVQSNRHSLAAQTYTYCQKAQP